MKRYASMLLAVLLLASVLTGSPQANAYTKTGETRAIAIVFDNSGSMYQNGNLAWCRATYAMEVFASMLNTGDTLQIYPMWPITVGGKEYTMDAPLQITDPAKASLIRDIYTDGAGGTPIESVDKALAGIQSVRADKRYVIILTDGAVFYQNGDALTRSQTKEALRERLNQAGSSLTTMYLGIGIGDGDLPMKSTGNIVTKAAASSGQVLSELTAMCNQIFGRDTLPDGYLKGNTVHFDISMSKLIVFVQGENVSGVKVTGPSGAVGTKLSEASTHYGKDGCGNYKAVSDETLQGMMVTYTDCAAGDYTIEYQGTATSVEVYYEPNADLDFIFTDSQGNAVDPNALYEGDYKVSFGMKDAVTGKLISSELLGTTAYEGSYSVNGQERPISSSDKSGEVPVSLKMGDTFDARLTVTYLSGYTITKDSTDFGWPEGGIQVAAKPAGSLELQISGGQSEYSLQKLEEGEPYTVKVFYQGEQLTGQELQNVQLTFDDGTSNAALELKQSEECYILSLHYRDPASPKDTPSGECTVQLQATYAAQGSSPANTQAALCYHIADDFSPLSMTLSAPQDYIVISELAESQPITVDLRMDGSKLSQEEFAAVQLEADCGGLAYTLTPDPEHSCYTLQLLPGEDIAEGNYTVSVTAAYTDSIGRTTRQDSSAKLTLSNTPLWLKWAISLLALLILFLIIWSILHIRMLPKYAHVTKKDSTMIFDGEDATKTTTFQAVIQNGQMQVQSKYAGVKTGVTVDVTPGKESYLMNPQVRRNAEAKSTSLRKFGTATIQEASIGNIKYVLNEDTGKLERVPKNDKPYLVKHGMQISYSGTMLNAGVPKSFAVKTKLNFKKK